MEGLVFAHHLEHLLALDSLRRLQCCVLLRGRQRRWLGARIRAVVRRVIVERIRQQPAARSVAAVVKVFMKEMTTLTNSLCAAS